MRRHQYRNECLLASACAITGTDYETARALYQEIYGAPWWDAGDFDSERKRRWTAFLQDYILPAGDATMRALHTILIAPTAPTGHDLTGTGIIVIENADRTRAHAMAYCDGLIEDPGDGNISTLDEILARHSGWYVRSISPINKGR